MITFSDFAISPALVKMLERQNITTPTPIQEKTIPVGLDGKDVIGIAQTGTGKTLAFGLPMIENIRRGEFGLVLAPTRELAIQIEDTFKSLNVKTALLIGGAPLRPQVGQLRGRPMVVIATPGRLVDHMQQKTIDLRDAYVVTLDEADRMLDMGFAAAIKKILSFTPSGRQTMLFSATMPKAIADLAKQYLNDPVRIEIASAGTAAENIEHELVMLAQDQKPNMLNTLLDENKGSILVFTRTRHGARKLARTIRNNGHKSAEIHSDRSLAQRREALTGFKSGQYRILVATDIAARGIDVKDIELVVNYDIPMCPEDYVHRIGRTGRAGASGKAITLATLDQSKDIRDIEKVLKAKLPISPLSMFKPIEPKPVTSSRRPVNAFRTSRSFR